MTESKKEWHTPKLIVFVRSRPEEAVLLACKMLSGAAASGTWLQACGGGEPPGLKFCMTCDDIVSS